MGHHFPEGADPMSHQPKELHEHHQFHHHHRNDIILPVAALFGLLLAVFGLVQAPLPEITKGLWAIITSEDVLITDYIALAGMGAAFVNAGLVTIIAAAILYMTDESVNGSTLVTIGLMAGFSLFGKNIVNIWPIMFGTALYALLKREPFARYVDISMRTTALAPIVSFMGCTFSPWAGLLSGMVIGFLIPPVTEYTYKIQNGMNLYSIGFACGLIAMMLVPAFKAFGLTPQTASYWSTGNNLVLGCLMAAICLALIIASLCRKRRKRTWYAYRKLLRTSGRSPSDYLRVFGYGPVLLNMGVNGLIATAYILLIGGDLNGPTIGAIFTIMGFSAYGKHAFNIVPVMAGVLLGSLLNRVPFNSSALQIAGLFGTTLAPFSGFFGWPFGVLAGLLHSSVVLHAGLPLEGMNLYNNGFSGGLVAIVLYPIITSLVRHRRPVLQAEDLFDVFEHDEPQRSSTLIQHDNDDIQMPH